MGQKIRCLFCGYVWNPKSDHIPAKCPNCGRNPYKTKMYQILDVNGQPIKDNSFPWEIVIFLIIIFLILILSIVFKIKLP